jgi:hypothetical protein
MTNFVKKKIINFAVVFDVTINFFQHICRREKNPIKFKTLFQ